MTSWHRLARSPARGLLLLSLACGVLALGLPYGSWYLPGYYIPGWYVPEMCVLVGPIGDQTLDCTPSYLASPIFGPSAGGLQPGSETTWRVTFAAVLVLTLLVLRSGNRSMARVTLGVGIVGVAVDGLHPLPGAWCATAAIVLLALAFHRLGLVGLPRARRGPVRYRPGFCDVGPPRPNSLMRPGTSRES